MRANPLALALSVAGAVSITASSALLVPNRTPPAPLSLVASSDVIVETKAIPEIVLTVPPTRSDDVLSARTIAPTFERELTGSLSSPMDCSFDVTFVPTDALGRPVPGRTVMLALDGHVMNDMGASSWNGELNLSWKGSVPVINAVVGVRGAGTEFTRVRLEAGRSVRVRLDADVSGRFAGLGEECAKSAMPEFGSEAFQFSPKWSQRSTGDFRVRDGRGTFTDPMLLTRVIVPEERGGGFGFGSSCCGCGGGMPRYNESISFFVHDEAGIGIPHVPYIALLPNGGPIEGTADGSGHFVIDVRASQRFEVQVGGGTRRLVKTTVNPREHAAVIDVTIPHAVMGLGRLVSASGASLQDWIVSANGADGFQGSMRTDELGCFAIALPDEKPVELRARPASLPWATTCCVARSFRGADVSQAIVVSSPDPIAAICRIDVPADMEGEAPSIRFVRSDTGEGVELMPFEIGAEHDNVVRFGFRDDTLMPGDYALEILASGCEPLRKTAMTLVAGANDLGVLVPRPRPRMRIDGAGTDPVDFEWAYIETRIQGVRVTSKTVLASGLFAVPEGEFGLYVDDQMRHGEVPQSAMRIFRTKDGSVIPCGATPAAKSTR